jgi:hypothetical protein
MILGQQSKSQRKLEIFRTEHEMKADTCYLANLREIVGAPGPILTLYKNNRQMA